jgi:hypothetical protein
MMLQTANQGNAFLCEYDNQDNAFLADHNNQGDALLHQIGLTQSHRQHYRNAYDAIVKHAKLFFKLDGVAPYITPPPPDVMPWWVDDEKVKYTRTFLAHYLPPHKKGKFYDYVNEHGQAIDHTTFLCKRSVIKSLPEEYRIENTLQHIFHMFVDLYNAPHTYKVDGHDFCYGKDFLKKKTANDRKAFIISKVKVLVDIMIDEMFYNTVKVCLFLHLGNMHVSTLQIF